MKKTNLCFSLVRFCAVALALSSTITNAEITILASAGDRAPDGNGIYTAAGFAGNTLVDLNNNGQVSFTARLTATEGGTSDDRVIIRADRSGQELILRKGQQLDALGVGIEDVDIAPDINNNGGLAFRVSFKQEGGIDSTNDSAIFRWTPDQFTTMVREGDVVNSTSVGPLFSYFTSELVVAPVLLENNDVAFSTLRNYAPFLGISDGGAIDQVFINRFMDDDFPINFWGGSTFFNSVGQASLRTNLDTGISFLLLESTEEGLASFQPVVQAGDTTPDGLGTFSVFAPTGAPNGIPLNDSGEMVFEARAEGALGTFEALYAGSPGAVREIAREDTIPVGSELEIERFRFTDIDEDGRVAFMVAAGFSKAQLWLERPDFSGIDLILEEGQDVGTGDWTVRDIGQFVLNNSNQLVVVVELNSPTQGIKRGVLFYDVDSDLFRPVIIQGEALDGSTVSQIWFTSRSIQGRRALNDQGEVVFMYELENEITGIALWERGQPYGYLRANQIGEGTITLDPRFELVEEDLYRVSDPEGKTFELSATPASGYGFSAWSGGLASQEADLEFVLGDFETLELTATFDVLPPAITNQSPTAVEVMVGEPLLLRVEADGLNLDFQWSAPQSGGGGTRDPGVSYTITDSANETTLEIASAELADGGTYSVSVTNSAGTVQSADMIVTVVEPEPPAGNWYDSAINLGEGWRWFDWFKAFKPVGDDGWIYHETHGWLYALGEDATGLFLWDGGIKRWLYTNETLYPWVYAFGPQGGWLWFFENSSSGARVFARGGSGEILSEQQLQPNVTLLGAVNSPGPVALPDSGELTLSEAFATVRGITRLGDPRAVNIRRLSASGETRTLIVNFSRIISGDDPDFILQGGDVVYVPERIF